MNKGKGKGFTLIELLVVIAIIGILATLAIVSLQNARQSARDTKRIADIKQIQTALELYHNDNGQYPDSIGTSIATGGITYMNIVPTSPSPADGDCQVASNTYSYLQTSSGDSYTIDFCLGKQTGDLISGVNQAIPGGVISDNVVIIDIPVVWVCGDTISDTDSNNYNTIELGTQCWMAENLATTKYNDGDDIPNVTGSTDWANLTSPGYAWYDNDQATYKDTYGALYNHYVVQTDKICPTGWKVPSDEEWKILEMYLGMSQSQADSTGYRGTNEGSKLAGNASLWNSSLLTSNVAFGSSGFMALSGGRLSTGGFANLAQYGSLWASTLGTTGAHRRTLYSGNSKIYRDNGLDVRAGISLRCLWDNN